MARKFDYTIIDIIESTAKNIKAQPINLGGLSGPGGGIGSPPGGFIGWLPQTRVAYDDDEIASSGITASGTLLDNLNHIRYRLGILESGGGASPLVVEQLGGVPSVNNVDKIIISGGTVIDMGGGDVLIAMSGGGGGDSTYLRLDGSNDPITGPIEINLTSFGSHVGTPYGLKINLNTGEFGGGESIINTNGFAAWMESHGDTDTLEISQRAEDATEVTYATVTLDRQGDGSAVQFDNPVIQIYDIDSDATYLGGTLEHYDSGFALRASINPYVDADSALVMFSSVNAITSTGRLLSLKNQGSEKFFVDGNGLVNIPTGQTYNINGSPHAHPIQTAYLPFGIYLNISPMSGNPSYPYGTSIDRTLTFVGWTQSVIPAATNNGSNYWIIKLLRWSDGATIATLNTSALTAGVPGRLSTTSFSIASIGTSGIGIVMECSKFGSPGNLYAVGPLLEVTA